MTKKIKEQNENLKLWLAVEKTKPKFLKKVTVGGRTFSSIDPQYQLQKATEQFGPYGGKWGLKNIEWGETWIDTTLLATLSATFYTPLGEVETGNSIKASYVSAKGRRIVDDEYRKKMITNTLSKELSRLGFNADVFMGKWDDEKYVSEAIEEEFKDENQDKIDKLLEELKQASTLEEVRELYSKNKEVASHIVDRFTKRKDEIEFPQSKTEK